MAIDIDLLSEIPYFAGLAKADLEAVSQRMFEQSVERGDMILMEDDPSEAVYFVVSGAVKVFKHPSKARSRYSASFEPASRSTMSPSWMGGQTWLAPWP